MSDPTLQPGDIVHVAMQVVEVRPNGLLDAQPMDGSGNVCVYRHAIKHVEPRPLKVGDVVDSIDPKSLARRGVIKAIVDDQAWVFWDFINSNTVWPLEGLKRQA